MKTHQMKRKTRAGGEAQSNFHHGKGFCTFPAGKHVIIVKKDLQLHIALSSFDSRDGHTAVCTMKVVLSRLGRGCRARISNPIPKITS